MTRTLNTELVAARPRNARFWVLVNHCPVKMTMKPKQSLRWMRHDIYKDSQRITCDVWEFDGKSVYNSCAVYCSDKYGPHEYHGSFVCCVEDLHAGYAVPNTFTGQECGLLLNEAYPDWCRISLASDNVACQPIYSPTLPA